MQSVFLQARFTQRLLSVLLCAMLGGCAVGPRGPITPINGVVWQPHNEAIAPKGQWEKLGAKQLLVQWTAVDGLAFVPGTGMPEVPVLPNWERISNAPWATAVVLGLAGRFDESTARAQIGALTRYSSALAKLPTPLNVVGWYFPVEVDPTWKDAYRLADLLAPLPRPLWISVYDNSNIGAHNLADSLATWLPKDVGVFFQDGVGVHAREATVARRYADTLIERLGPSRVQMIAEVFRPAVGGGFRPATADEIKPQLAQYTGLSVFLFEAPTYVSDALVDQLIQQ